MEPAAVTPDGDEVMDRDNDAQGQGHGEYGYAAEVKEQDRWLPIANVARIMKLALPENAKIAKEAKECMQECVSEFISFITSEASEKCQQEKRKTVNGEDILFAMTSLGFENYAEALKIYLTRYRETLLANQGNKSAPGPGGYNAAGAGGSNAAGNAAAGGAAFGQDPNAQHNNVLSGDQDMGETEPATAFGYAVHNGNGAGDF